MELRKGLILLHTTKMKEYEFDAKGKHKYVSKKRTEKNLFNNLNLKTLFAKNLLKIH